MSGNSEMNEARVTGQKSKQVEELKGGIDARDLIGRFRSKADIYEYLSQHRKFSQINPGMLQGRTACLYKRRSRRPS